MTTATKTAAPLLQNGTKLVIDFGELSMAEQADVFEQMEALGMVTDPTDGKPPSPSHGVRFNATVAWVVLRRDRPELDFDYVWHNLRGRDIEVAEANPTEAEPGGEH
jgi:hypothetical protein